MNVNVTERKVLDVCSEEFGTRLGWVVETGHKKEPWLAIAVIPHDAKGMILGVFRKPQKAIKALVENESDQWTLGRPR